MKHLAVIFVIPLLLVAAAPAALAGSYNVDYAHSSITFAVKHMVISKTKGTFTDYSAWFVYEPGKPENWRAEATIQAASIDTQDKKRDEHLRSADFFDVANHPEIKFVSTGVKMKDDNEAILTGDLTMLGTTLPVELELEINGVVEDPWGNSRAGFTATGKIDRKEWGLTWNKTLDSGGLVVGDEVTIMLEVEGILKK